eukprot:6199355-Pleurochrysis_carterae.AAC.2
MFKTNIVACKPNMFGRAKNRNSLRDDKDAAGIYNEVSGSHDAGAFAWALGALFVFQRQFYRTTFSNATVSTSSVGMFPHPKLGLRGTHRRSRTHGTHPHTRPLLALAELEVGAEALHVPSVRLVEVVAALHVGARRKLHQQREEALAALGFVRLACSWRVGGGARCFESWGERVGSGGADRLRGREGREGAALRALRARTRQAKCMRYVCVSYTIRSCTGAAVRGAGASMHVLHHGLDPVASARKQARGVRQGEEVGGVLQEAYGMRRMLMCARERWANSTFGVSTQLA